MTSINLRAGDQPARRGRRPGGDQCGNNRRDDATAATGLEALVDEYIQWYGPRLEGQLSQFRNAPTDEDAISDAALARVGGRKHPHQRRIPYTTLEKSSRRLLKNLSKVRRTTSFEELIELVNDLIRPIDGIGELAVYDTALRIGARFDHEPEKMYVHSGTRDGVRKLDSDLANRETIEMDELPAPIRKLTPREAEDFLCIYKNTFSREQKTKKKNKKNSNKFLSDAGQVRILKTGGACTGARTSSR